MDMCCDYNLVGLLHEWVQMYLCYVMSEHFDAAKTVLGRKLENKIIFNF